MTRSFPGAAARIARRECHCGSRRLRAPQRSLPRFPRPVIVATGRGADYCLSSGPWATGVAGGFGLSSKTGSDKSKPLLLSVLRLPRNRWQSQTIPGRKFFTKKRALCEQFSYCWAPRRCTGTSKSGSDAGGSLPRAAGSAGCGSGLWSTGAAHSLRVFASSPGTACRAPVQRAS